MKYHAIMFMCNDLQRASFVASNFKKHNSDIKLTVYNGGESLDNSFIGQNQIDELIEGPNLWHKKTRHAPGSFGYGWFTQLFLTYHKHNPDYLIFLETDVKTNKKIEIEPEYDICGPVTTCGYMEKLVMYDYWSNYVEGKPFTEDTKTTWIHKYHTGMGATSLSKRFFELSEKNLKLVYDCYETIPLNCYADVLLTCFARYSGCTMGDWKDASDTRGTFRLKDNNWHFENFNDNCALIHNYKV